MSAARGAPAPPSSAFPGFTAGFAIGTWAAPIPRPSPAPPAAARRLRPEYLAVTLGGHNIHALSEMPLAQLAGVVASLGLSTEHTEAVTAALRTVQSAPAFPAAGGPGLPAPGAARLHALRGRGAAHQAGRTAGQRADLPDRAAGRAHARAASLRGAGLAGCAAGTARRGQHGDRGRARSPADARRRPPGRHGAGAGAAGGRVVAQGRPRQVADATRSPAPGCAASGESTCTARDASRAAG